MPDTVEWDDFEDPTEAFEEYRNAMEDDDEN